MRSNQYVRGERRRKREMGETGRNRCQKGDDREKKGINMRKWEE